jgi:hypothetical protein
MVQSPDAVVPSRTLGILAVTFSVVHPVTAATTTLERYFAQAAAGLLERYERLPRTGCSGHGQEPGLRIVSVRQGADRVLVRAPCPRAAGTPPPPARAETDPRSRTRSLPTGGTPPTRSSPTAARERTCDASAHGKAQASARGGIAEAGASRRARAGKLVTSPQRGLGSFYESQS